MRSKIGLILILFLASCANEKSGIIQATDGVDIHYKQQGKGDLNLIFIHGWSATSDCWNNQFEYFSDKYNVISLDLPGFGQSGQIRNQWNIDLYGNDIITIIEKLNLENVVLIGHSMGGLVAMSATTQRSDKIRGLVLVDIVSDIENYRTKEWIENLISSWKIKIKKGNLKDLNDFFSNPDFTQRYSDMLPEDIPDFWWDLVRDTFNWMNDDLKPAISKIDKPIILINSNNVETDIESIKKYAKDFQVKIIPETSHYLFWDKPVEFNNILIESLESKFDKSL